MIRKQLLLGMILLTCFCLISANSPLCYAGQADHAAQSKSIASESGNKPLGQVMKTYTLKHIKPEDFLKASRLLLTDATSYGNTINVVIWEGNVTKFEDLLRKLDVAKKMLQFQVFVIVASREQTPAIEPKSSGSSSAKPVMPVVIAPKYSGEPVTLRFKEADLRDVIQYLAEFAKLNVVIDPDVRGTITCDWANIPWDYALDVILFQNKMGKIIDGKFLRVAPVRVLSPEKGEGIENKELKKVLDELKALWNFKSYEVDGPTFVTVREDSGPNNFKLVTNRPLNVVFSDAKVVGEEPGKRTITIGQLKLSGKQNFEEYVYVDTHDVELKEKGYLVAGVSGFGAATKALILVISGEIR